MSRLRILDAFSTSRLTEDGFVLATFQSAMAFLENVDPAHLNLEEGEWAREMSDGKSDGSSTRSGNSPG